MWFTDSAANSIGRITNGGVITNHFPVTARSEPSDITAGPDGALWFTEFRGDKIGRIETALRGCASVAASSNRFSDEEAVQGPEGARPECEKGQEEAEAREMQVPDSWKGQGCLHLAEGREAHDQEGPGQGQAQERPTRPESTEPEVASR